MQIFVLFLQHKYLTIGMTSNSEQKNTLKRVQDLISTKYFTLARELVEDKLVSDPSNFQLRVALLNVCVETNSYQEGLALLDELAIEQPENDALFQIYPRMLVGVGRMDDAIERAHELQERKAVDDFQALGMLFDVCETASRTEEMAEIIERMRPEGHLQKIGYDSCRAKLYSSEKRFEEAAQLCESAFAALSDSDGLLSQQMIDDRKIDLAFRAAKAYDRMGEYDMAWAAASRAHEVNREKSSRFRPSDYEVMAEKTMKLFNRKTLRALAHAQAPLQWEPLYIVGNPRSGTSLLEQILSMHPSVANGGEMSVTASMQQGFGRLTDSFNEWPLSVLDMTSDDADALGRWYMSALESFASDAKVVSNKALNLQLQVGFLSLVTPNSRAIMLYRHPLDNCVSCFTTNLLVSGHVYCSNLDSLARVWLARRRLQEHWLEHVDIPVMELAYEGLVQNQEAETRRLIEFIGLDWNEDCLEFYKSKFVARTISYDQVNRKMYTTSDGRWKNYEKHLGPLMDSLSAYI